MSLREIPVRRALQVFSAVSFTLAAALIVVALVGPSIGLGAAEQSIVYIWLGLSRSDLAVIAVTLFVGSSCVGLIAAVRRWKQLLANSALALASILMAILVLEAMTRVIGGVPILAFRNWLAERNALLTTHALAEYDPLVGWVQKSNISVASNDSENSFTTGAYGIRLNRAAATGLPAIPILAVGDSFTAGSDVGDRHSWPAQLERLSGRPVVNAGVGGWGADQIVLRAESLVPVLKPSAVVVSFFHGDIDRAGLSVYSGANKPYFTIENGVLVQHNNPVPVYSGRVEETPWWLILPSHSYLVQFTMDRIGWATWWQHSSVSYVKARNDPHAVSCALLQRLRDKLTNDGIEFLFVVQYGALDVKAQPESASRIARCARERNIETLDLWDDMIAIHRRSVEEYNGLWVSQDGKTFGHMSASGNAVVARRVAEMISKAER